jgi:3-hydroxyisobutyrate dehydrogenase
MSRRKRTFGGKMEAARAQHAREEPMRVSLLGTGLMGRPMAERLLAAGHEVVVWNRTRARAVPLAERGARVATTPGEAVESSECAVLMLADAQAIESVLLPHAEPLSELAGRAVLQMGTIAPSESRAFAAALVEAGAEYLEAPVLGSIPEARAGELLVMVGATEEQLGRWRPLLACFGREPLRVGPVGRAAAAKLALNQLIAALTSGFALSLGFVQRQGVPVERFMEILRQSALHAPAFDKKLPRLLERDYAGPNFPLEHLTKDVRLFLGEARPLGLSCDALEGVERLLARALAEGHAGEDYSALFEEVALPQRDGGAEE